MTKYVMTKDGKIVKINLEGKVFTSRYEIVGEPKDSIEELCDEFVIIDKRASRLLSEKAQRVKDFVLEQYGICSYCNAVDGYCPCDCLMKRKAKLLSNAQWEDLARKYGNETSLDAHEISKSIMRRKVY